MDNEKCKNIIDIATNSVEKIINDLMDRSGLGNAFSECDEDIQQEIRCRWAKIIMEELILQEANTNAK